MMRKTLAIGCFALGALAVVHFAGPSFGLAPLVLKNTSPSMPVGFYRLDHRPPVRVGEIVVYPNPPQHREPWLMKRVAGVEGSLFCWNEASGTHWLDGEPMPAPSRMALDIGVPVWKGCRRLTRGEFVGYGEGDSYDSRHLGILDSAKLWGAYQPWSVSASSSR